MICNSNVCCAQSNRQTRISTTQFGHVLDNVSAEFKWEETHTSKYSPIRTIQRASLALRCFHTDLFHSKVTQIIRSCAFKSLRLKPKEVIHNGKYIRNLFRITSSHCNPKSVKIFESNASTTNLNTMTTGTRHRSNK